MASRRSAARYHNLPINFTLELMPILPDSAIGPLLAAAVGAAASLLTLIISKESKTSEFRKEWIEALRVEFSLFVAHLHSYSITVRTSEENSSVVPPVELNKSMTSIRLRLNPKEGNAQRVLAIIAAIEAMDHAGKIADGNRLEELEQELLPIAQGLLKAEWDRVKQGELVFQIARGVSFAVALICIALLLWAAAT